MKIPKLNQKGFTIIEIAIVLLVVAIMLGYSLSMFPIQQELKQYRDADAELSSIMDSLIAFAQVNGRLPCPDTNGDVNGTGAGNLDGFEDTEDRMDNITGAAVPPAPPDGIIDDCKAYFGFLPARTLAIQGNVDANGLLLDPWGNAYGYAVSESNAGTGPAIDFVSPNGIREEGIGAFLPPPAVGTTPPDLFVCDDSAAAGNDLDCSPAGANSNLVVGNVAAVVVSRGKDPDIAGSNIQIENADDFHNGTNDKVYIRSTKNETAGTEFDDVIKWLPPNLLFSKMIEAGQLP